MHKFKRLRTNFLKLTGISDLRPVSAHIWLLKWTWHTDVKVKRLLGLKELIRSLKLKKQIWLLGLTRGKVLQALTGHTDLLKFQ